ncbi:probable protein phosphatase 2C 55 [Daucus carota subsp. sativus]|uniref:probable protein phosphatase 2C 55 n=1 Tax=Daucus carota subsp. sativus TaxID=79200 RepID=UPI003083AE05
MYNYIKETGGDDAHFVCVNEKVIGVTDGVGGWAGIGVNAGLYARELMSNSVGAILNEPKDGIDPFRVLTRLEPILLQKLRDPQQPASYVLKKKGDGCTVFESPVQQHGFNFTYQLECSSRSDQPSSGQVFMIPVVPGDVIVVGTDGLFDNLFSNERALDRHKQTPFSTADKEVGFRYYGGKLDDITVVVS